MASRSEKVVSYPRDRGMLSGFRNKIINGDFDIWQRGNSQTISGYGSDDRWLNLHVGSTKSVERLSFLPGQVPFGAKYYSRTAVTSVAGAGSFVTKQHRIESVRTLAGKKVTVTFWARGYDGANALAFDLYQHFGTGGTPSAYVEAIGATKVTLNTDWQKFSYVVAIPSIAGKTIGSNGDDYLCLRFWFDAGSTYNVNTQSMGQQSGLIDISHVSLVEGDARSDTDPFAARHIHDELMLCRRYYQEINTGRAWIHGVTGYSGELQARVFFDITPKRSSPSVSLTSAGFSYFDGAWRDTAITVYLGWIDIVSVSWQVPAYLTPSNAAPAWLLKMRDSTDTVQGKIFVNAEL